MRTGVRPRLPRVLRAEEYEALRRREEAAKKNPPSQKAPRPPSLSPPRALADWARVLFDEALESKGASRVVPASRLLRGWIR